MNYLLEVSQTQSFKLRRCLKDCLKLRISPKTGKQVWWILEGVL